MKTLDKARKALQQNQGSSYYQSKYQDTLASIQTQVLAAHRTASEKLEKWEREFAVKNGFPPTHENYNADPTMRTVYKKKKLSSELLKHWKITIHLR